MSDFSMVPSPFRGALGPRPPGDRAHPPLDSWGEPAPVDGTVVCESADCEVVVYLPEDADAPRAAWQGRCRACAKRARTT